MRRVHVDSAIPTMKLAKTIFTSEGRILLTAGAKMGKNYISKIKELGINEIYVEDEISEGIICSDVVSEQTRLDAKMLVKNIMNGYVFSNAIDAEAVKNIINKLIDELLSNSDILLSISEIRSVDDYTFEHSVNVCILSLIAGIRMGFGNERLKDLGIGALLHDIGKLKIPQEILKKPSQLTVEEFEEIKKHTVYGYEMLKSNPNISMISAFIAYGHHERYDGSGYPLQLKGESIHQCARIVAIADVYDALTSDRVYRKRLNPNEVVEYITNIASSQFDSKVINCFIKFLAIYPTGTAVKLNNNQRGLVIKTNRINAYKPTIRVIYDEFNNKLNEHYEIDLMFNPSISIVDFCEL